jgi:hypothetical protein
MGYMSNDIFVHILSASPITGWFADTRGTEWITLLSLLSAVPWLIIMIIQTSLPLFIVSYAISSQSYVLELGLLMKI